MVCGEERFERSDLFHFLQDLPSVFLVPPGTITMNPTSSRLTRVSSMAPTTCTCGFDHGQARSVCVQGRTVNTQKGCEPGLWGWNWSWWPRLVSHFLSSVSSGSQAGTGRLCVSQSARGPGSSAPHFLPRAGLPGHRPWPCTWGQGAVGEQHERLGGAAETALCSVSSSSGGVSVSARLLGACLAGERWMVGALCFEVGGGWACGENASTQGRQEDPGGDF